jgi:hypothetical protein
VRGIECECVDRSLIHQAVVEKQMGLPVASFMDAQSELDFYRNQLFFTTSFCQPLFQGLADTYLSLVPRLEQVLFGLSISIKHHLVFIIIIFVFNTAKLCNNDT